MSKGLLGLCLGFYIILGLGSVPAQGQQCRQGSVPIRDKRQDIRECQVGSDPMWHIVQIRTYNSSGQLISEENYAPVRPRGGRAVFNGLQTYWTNNIMTSQALFRNGVPQWLKRWYNNGQLVYHAQFNNAVFKNPFVIFDNSGGTELEVTFENGQFCKGNFVAKTSKGRIVGRLGRSELLGVSDRDAKQLASLQVFCMAENMKF